MKKKAISIIILLIIGVYICVSAKNKAVVPKTITAFAFDTIITFQIYEGEDSDRVLEECQKKCEYYEAILSRTVEGSDVWNINHSNGQPVQVSNDTARLISESIKYCELSQGALDITMAPVIELWNFSGEGNDNNAYGLIPTQSEIEEKINYVNYNDVSADNNTVLIPKGYAIDFGAVAKGYIADCLAEYMIDNGVTSAIINLGGNTLCIGMKPEKSLFSTDYVPFKVGVQKPFGAPGDVEQVVELGGRDSGGRYYKGVHIDSLVTSGTYQRYFEKDGRIYHHILSTDTGMPIWNGLDSVSIHCGSSLEADALSTAVFCMGKEKGRQLLDSLPEAEGIFISSKTQKD